MMSRKLSATVTLFVISCVFSNLCTIAEAMDAASLVRQNFDYMRDETSVSTVEMTVHRPDWERVSVIKAWTRGEKDSLITIILPPKDRGNGTLKLGRNMWMFNPKVNRVIKLPPSMMSQSWMGSDFSNNDLAKSDSIINDYNHRILGTETSEDKTVYKIESMPKPDAPVIWGMITIKIREDFIPLEEIFYDEDFEPVKILTFSGIKILGGKLYPTIMKMRKAEAEDEEYTLLKYKSLEFNITLKDSHFSRTSLKNPRR
ncbi:MAG: outer membrane lipoprotein-sorting protein [Deltaproteobacteria bacterium]|nr:outer membrane lipoprotein-sorting protein [Deltaproteobacteria bacterium]